MRAALTVEWWKFRRSRVVLVATLLMGLLLPLMGLGFYKVALSGGVGALADKASALMVGEGWAGYLGFIDQIAAVAVFIGAGVVVAWTFGREHADRTFASLFSLPVSRASIATAKYVVLTLWIVGLSLLIVGVGWGLGVVGGIETVAPDSIGAEALRLVSISVTAGLLSLTIGAVASVGRGYLAAIGTMIVIVAVAQVAVLFGTGGWFPFAVPGLLAVAGSEGIPPISPIQLILVPALTIGCVWLTISWWRTTEVV